jgi:DNA-binding beta-propeller fold protein YncE
MLAGLYPGWQGDVLTVAGGAIFPWSSHLEGAKETGPSMLAVHPEGRVYAVNSQGRNVSVIDAATAERKEQFDVQGHDLRLLPGGRLLAVRSREGVRFLDTATNSRVRYLRGYDLRSFRMSASGAYVLAFGEGIASDEDIVLCISATTGEALTLLPDFANPVAVVVDGGGK